MILSKLGKKHDLHGITRSLSEENNIYEFEFELYKFRLVHSPRSNFRYIMVVAFSNKPVPFFFCKVAESVIFAPLPGQTSRCARPGGLT